MQLNDIVRELCDVASISSGEGRAEPAGGAGVERAEAGGEFGGGQAALPLEPAGWSLSALSRTNHLPTSLCHLLSLQSFRRPNFHLTSTVLFW